MPLYRPTDRPLPSPHPRLGPEAVLRCFTPQLSDRRRRRIDRVVRHRLASVTVLLERLYDPHNGAAVLRSSEGLGLLHLHAVPFEQSGGFDYSRSVTQNADKWLNVYLHADITAAVGYLQRAGFACWAAVPPPLLERGAGPGVEGAEGIGVDRPTALVFGNEHEGLSAEAIDACDGRFSLPMFGFTESYNLSVSVALTLERVVARRRASIGRSGDLPAEVQRRLRAAYYARSVNHAPALLRRHLLELEAGG